MDTVATIPTGSMAERWKWKSFVGWGLFCGAIYYPLFGAWTWGGGWLSQLGNSLDLGNGYVDFAGSGVVHAVGGVAALAGAIVLGPRIGKYGPGRQAARHARATTSRWPCSARSSCCSAGSASTPPRPSRRPTSASRSSPRTRRSPVPSVRSSACSGSCGAAGSPIPGMMANGMLAGLVAITAPCAFVEPWAAAVIGIDRRRWSSSRRSCFLEREVKVDDPVGAISVHGMGGLFGVLCVGIFADGKYGGGWNLTDWTAPSPRPTPTASRRRHRHPLRRLERLPVSWSRQVDRCARRSGR